MTRTLKLLAAGSAVAMAAAGTAHAEGTASGTVITNTATVRYQVGTVQQADRTASNAFIVDRKVNMTVVEVGTVTTLVTPGQAQAATTFRVTNLSNDRLDFALAVGQPAGVVGVHDTTKNDIFSIGSPVLYNDAGTTVGVFDTGDQVITYLDEIPADNNRIVHVVGSIPLTRDGTAPVVNGDISVVSLTATAHQANGGTTGALGAIHVQSATNDTGTTTPDTVFADGAGSDDAARSGSFSARDDYTVQAALLTVNKYSRVLSDPFNGTTNPKMIPGAVVEYCIAVSNAAGGQTATTVQLTDDLPLGITYNDATIRLDATVTGQVCSAGTPGGTYTTGNRRIAGTLSDIAQNVTRGLYFTVTVNATP